MVDYTNKTHRFISTIDRWSLMVRRRFFGAFVDLMTPSPTDTIVDIGVTPDTESETTNYLEKWYSNPSQITATSIEDASEIEKQFPGLQFVQTDDGPLPFVDGQFNISFSSAVVEHVGSRERQRAFIHEQLRVSDRFFVTTPNRWYPLELHTFLPVLHWLPQPMHQKILSWLGKKEWAKTQNLNLLSKRTLLELFPEECDVTIAALRTLGFESNLYAYGRSRRD